MKFKKKGLCQPRSVVISAPSVLTLNMFYYFQELTFHYSLHTSLDVIEEKLSTLGRTNDHR